MSKKLVDATVLVKCTKPTRHDCNDLRDALVKVDNIAEAFLTEYKINNVKFCVGGTLVTTQSKLKTIEKEIRHLKNKQNKTIPVDKLAMIIGVD